MMNTMIKLNTIKNANNSKRLDDTNICNDTIHSDDFLDEVHIMDLTKEISKKAASNPEFLKLWNESENEYELLFQVIGLRKKNHLSQKDLAMLTGTRQEVISRMESRKNSPSLASFCKIVNSLGYELKIEKKS